MSFAHPSVVAAPEQLTRSCFLLVGCQGGAESVIERRQQQWFPTWQKTAWRRGLVSFRLPEAASGQTAAVPPLVIEHLIFAQTACRCLGQVTGNNDAERIEAACNLIGTAPFADVHVWNRNPRLNLDTEPIRTGLVTALELPTVVTDTPPGSLVLDCVVDSEDRWWIGWHHVLTAADDWPGGRYPGQLPKDAVSRAWLKLDEAINRFDLTFRRNQQACELGAAPGGSCQRLLEADLSVIGVDPATIDPRVIKHPQFTHWQKRTRDVRVKDLRRCDWLVTDMNIDPASTIAALERVVAVSGRRPRGIISTLKLTDWSQAEELDDWCDRLSRWGYQPQVRQLSTGGREVCLVATRKERKKTVS